MVNCCRREGNLRYREIVAEDHPDRRTPQSGCCRAPFRNKNANAAWHLTALAVMGVCTFFFTSMLFNPTRERDIDSVEFGLVTASLSLLSLASFISEGVFLKRRGTKSRHLPAPSHLILIAVTTGCVTWAVFESKASKMIANYNYTEAFIEQHLNELKDSCEHDVVQLPQAFTSDDCTVCDRDSGWYAGTYGPFQAWQDDNVSSIYCFKPNIQYPCLMTRNWLHDIKMNYSYPGQKYLCGNSITETTLNDTQLSDIGCVHEFLEKYLGFFPPMTLKVAFLDNNCAGFVGSATYRNLLEPRCNPYAEKLLPYALRMPCASPYFVSYFNGLDTQIQTIRNYSIPYPQRAHDLLKESNNYALGFAIYAMSLTAATYECFTCSPRFLKRVSTQEV